MPTGDEEVNYNSKTGLGTYCQALNTKTLTPSNPTPPKGPTIEEMLQEIEDQFANTNIQAPVLKQSYNLGTGLNENNPNVYKNQAINFYVDAPTARWEGDLMIGHVEIESYPTQMTIQYGNGDEDTFYTMGKPPPVMRIGARAISTRTRRCLMLAVTGLMVAHGRLCVLSSRRTLLNRCWYACGGLT